MSDRCSLYCVAKGADGERMYRKFSSDVDDGTPCNGAPNSVCINGICQVRPPTVLLEDALLLTTQWTNNQRLLPRLAVVEPWRVG